MLWQALGILVQAAGLALVFAHWRTRGGLGGGALAGGWALVLAGAAPWLLTASPEKALALGSLAPMLAGLGLLAPDALPRVGAVKDRRGRPVRREPGEEGPAAVDGRLSRNVARWFAALIAAPALALAAAAAWQAFVPLGPNDNLVGSAFLIVAVWTAAILWLLASVRPWRPVLWTSGVALLLAGLAALGAR
jgi:hypothetical protein